MVKKALVIAVDSYPTSPLRGCVNDANRISGILESKSCEFEVRRLTDADATRGKIREELIWLLQGSSMALLFFAGHGWRRPTGTYLVSHDSELHDEGIELQWLAGAIKKLCPTETSLILILDACHSGDGAIRNLETAIEDLNVQDLSPLNLPGTSRVLLAACKGPEVALEISHNGIVHGAFSHYLCSALEGHAADANNMVTINAAFDYVSMKLRGEGRQTPVLRGDQEGQLVLAKDVLKRGEWKHLTAREMPIEYALSKAEELLSSAQSAMTVNSFDDWQKRGFSAACQAFEPVLMWFRRRGELQPELLQNPEFKKKYATCTHMHKHLCAISPGISLPTGVLSTSIGSGSFGNVWKISGGSWAQPVCFKNYHAHDILDIQKDSRFRRGYQAMHQLDHPNIVKVRALSEVPFGFFMDFIEGANLRQLNPGASSEPEIVTSLLIEVAETLQHAHGRGVIHRDVKPENIVVSISQENEYSAFLTDFDLAWFSAATQVTKLADGFGSHYYAAPEQMNSPQSSGAHKATVDVYAFGQLCFFCVCGRDPMAFDLESNANTLSEALSRKWNDARASAEMLKLYRECVHYTPSKRIQDFRLISERLAKLHILLTSKSDSFAIDRVLEQLSYALTGKLAESTSSTTGVNIRSRSNRTGLNISILKDAPEICAIEIYFHPNSLLIEGRKSADVRALVNSRVDAMLNDFKRDHDAVRKGNKVGAYEFSIRIDRITKNQSGVLIARNIISRTIDLLEQA
jgi:serine/threonine protein kinase/uncharacterized caspase-like protein